ncbi:MAG: LamG-like jellyroll fold domain-containing protein, partial [Pseudomonadota bacterium]
MVLFDRFCSGLRLLLASGVMVLGVVAAPTLVQGQVALPPNPTAGQKYTVQDGETTLTYTFIRHCANNGEWKVTCKTCDSSSQYMLSGGSQGGELTVSCDMLTKGKSLIDNLGFNYHHYATDYGVGRGSADCGSCASGLSSGGGLMELLIERRHRSRNMTEYGSFGPGVYTNYDTKLFLNEVDGGLQLDIFDPRELRSKRLTDVIDGDALDGQFVDHRNNSVREARLLDALNALTTNLNNAVAVEVEAYNGYVHRFELIDLAGDTTDNTALVGHWRFDEASGSVAEDSTSENNDGTISGATRVATSGAPIPGGAGGALNFDGLNDSVNLGSPAALNISDEITMSAWIKPDSLAANPNDPFGISTVVAHVHGSSSENSAVFIRLRNGQYHAGSWDGSINQMAILDAPAEDEGNWVHLAAVYDGTTWRLYRNGRLAAASQKKTGAIPSGQEWRIGSAAWNGVSRRHFNGQIDDVRIYNRNILEGEIAQIAKQRVLAGRLTSVKDRNGYGSTISYRDGDFTQAQLNESPERQWQINTVTDAYGRVATFNYRSTQVAGQWAVERIDLPNGQDVDYLYEDDLHLTKVTHADGTESVFTYTPDAGTQTMKVSFDDAAASGTHRRKTAYLTNQIIAPGLANDLETAEIFNQSAMMIRMLTNGSSEVAYLNLQDPNLVNRNVIYEGAGK